MKPKRRNVLVALTVAAMVVGSVAWGVARAVSPPFDRAAWLAHPSSSDLDSPRWRMADDLLRHSLTPGLSSERVVTLLGTPQRRTRDLAPYADVDPSGYVTLGLTKDGTLREGIAYVWTMGVPVIDPVFLCVQFDGRGQVVRAWQSGH